MGRISALLTFCAGNSPVTGEFPSQRPVTRSFDVFFDLRLNINSWVKNREAGDLRRHRAHYDVIVMKLGDDPTQLVTTKTSAGKIVVVRRRLSYTIYQSNRMNGMLCLWKESQYVSTKILFIIVSDKHINSILSTSLFNVLLCIFYIIKSFHAVPSVSTMVFFNWNLLLFKGVVCFIKVLILSCNKD